MVDYSKWDKMQFDSDDEEQDAKGTDEKISRFQRQGRTVTAKAGEGDKLDNTSSVTFGGTNRGKIVTGVDALKSSAMKPTAQGRKQQVEKPRFLTRN